MIESRYVFKDVHMCVRRVTPPTNQPTLYVIQRHIDRRQTDKHMNIIELLVVVVAVVLVVNEL